MRPRDAAVALQRLRRVRALYESAMGRLQIGLIEPAPGLRRAWGIPPVGNGPFALSPSVLVHIWTPADLPDAEVLAGLDLLVATRRPAFPVPTAVSLLVWPGGRPMDLDRVIGQVLHRRGPAGRNKAVLWQVLRFPGQEADRAIRRAAVETLLLDLRLDRTERILLRAELLWTLGFIYGRQELQPAKLGSLITGVALDAVERRLLGRLLRHRPLVAALVQAGGTLVLGHISRTVLLRRRAMSS